VLRGVSQVLVSILMVGAVLVASTFYAYLASGLLTTYTPPGQLISRVGDVVVELRDVTQYGYSFEATVKLVNLGSERHTLSAAEVALLVAGTTGRSRIIYCSGGQGSLEPGGVAEVTTHCYLSWSDAAALFGSRAPPFDLVKRSVKFMLVRVVLSGGGSSLVLA